MNIQINNFGGIIPSMDPYTLPEHAAQVAHNVDLSGGTLECTEVSYPRDQVMPQELVTAGNLAEIARNMNLAGRMVKFIFECNYVRNSTREDYYIAQFVDSDGRDGPQSAVSDVITTAPGHMPLLDLPRKNGYETRLFRSMNAETGFGQIDELGDAEAQSLMDGFRQAVVDALPPNGNVPHANVNEAVKGALRHPAGYAVYFHENDLRPSSEWIDTERPWAAPKEYAYSFDSNIQCLALLNGSILVFTEEAVYKAVGQHPARLSVNKISDKPILDKQSLWTTNDLVGWVNEEGVAVFNGGSVTLLTGDYYRAEAWQALCPVNFSARTNDRAICLFGEEENLRFDLRNEGKAALSTFDSYTGTKMYCWKSRLYQLPKAQAWYAARIVADGYPIRLSLYADGQRTVETLALDEKDFLLPRHPATRRWEIVVEGKHEVRSVAIATNRAEV